MKTKRMWTEEEYEEATREALAESERQYQAEMLGLKLWYITLGILGTVILLFGAFR